jgi:hypothetical protein
MMDTDLIGMYIFALELAMLILTIIIGLYYDSTLITVTDDQVTSVKNTDTSSAILICGTIMAIPMGVQYTAAPAGNLLLSSFS